MITFIIPSYNNLQHLKNVYASIEKHAPEAEVILIDDGSTDGTWKWIWSIAEEHQHREVKAFRSETRVGHTILYDKGIELATNEIVGILHADMILGPNYIENMLKHLTPGKVVCATRIEPPLHPPGKEKIVADFGMDFNTLNIEAFEQYALNAQKEYSNQTTKGMFAPWILYKKDFEAIGGHDPLFAPFPYEDSDIFQRWILAGYELVQSRDAFVYHLTCRGHRWNDQVGKNDNYFVIVEEKARRNYIRKWGSWIRNDEYQYPIIPHKYNIGFRVINCTPQILEAIEPWCDTVYVADGQISMVEEYIRKEQPNTKFNLRDRIRSLNELSQNDITLTFRADQLNNTNINILTNLSDIITDSGEVGEFTLDIFNIEIRKLETYEHQLIKL